MIFLLTKYFFSDHIQKNEMGGAYSTYGGKERCIQGFGGERDGSVHSEDVRIDWRIILNGSSRNILRRRGMGGSLTLDAGLLARSQYPEGSATGHLDTGFSWFPCVHERILRWFPSIQFATTCLSCRPPDLNFLVTFFFFFPPIFVYM